LIFLDVPAVSGGYVPTGGRPSPSWQQNNPRMDVLFLRREVASIQGTPVNLIIVIKYGLISDLGLPPH
jgi:hypothetical protein